MVLAVDLGQSGTRIRWSEGHFESSRAKRATESPLEVLRDVFDELAEFHDGAIGDELVALSLTGIYGNVPDPHPYGELANEFFGAKHVVVMDDGLAGLIGALGVEDGVALSVGSGVVAVAKRQGTFSHADGLGHVFGDIGGGFWLGKHGLERALASRQRREEDAELLSFLADEVSQFDNLESYTGPEAHWLCITTAKKVLEAAENGLVGALTIRNHGARQLANTVKAAWINAGGNQNEVFSLALLGGLSRNRGYEEAIVNSVAKALPNAQLVSVRGNHLDGAIEVAQEMKVDSLPLLRWWHKS
ncbi:MAG TPA: BadF/BadG/BcrA/BcrD ATPase family protein [Candidatus Nanopelagicaceae bacterium]